MKKGEKTKSKLLGKKLLNLVEEFNLLDVWRPWSGSARQFMYYSNRHQTRTRIDACWMSTHMMKEVVDAEILPRLYADHNPLLIKLGKRQRINNWRMNVFNLEQEEFIEKLNKELEKIYKINITDEMERRTIWDTSKGVCKRTGDTI